MEPGAGGGEFKYLRGFNPYTVRSVHWFSNNALKNAVDNFLVQERVINQVKLILFYSLYYLFYIIRKNLKFL